MARRRLRRVGDLPLILRTEEGTHDRRIAFQTRKKFPKKMRKNDYRRKAQYNMAKVEKDIETILKKDIETKPTLKNDGN